MRTSVTVYNNDMLIRQIALPNLDVSYNAKYDVTALKKLSTVRTCKRYYTHSLDKWDNDKYAVIPFDTPMTRWHESKKEAKKRNCFKFFYKKSQCGTYRIELEIERVDETLSHETLTPVAL